MIKAVLAKLKNDGVGGLVTSVHDRFFPAQMAYYETVRHLFLDKVGLEIGGPTRWFQRGNLVPVYPDAGRIDNCNFSAETLWEGSIVEGATFRYDDRHEPGFQYVAEATDLHMIADGTYDFVLSSHAVEHTANPIQALSEWKRVLKDHGMLVLIAPHLEGTFDRNRPVTTLEHMISDFERKMPETDTTHVPEILELHDMSRDPECGSRAEFEARCADNLDVRGLHHHVFDTASLVELVDHMGLQITAVEAFRPFNIVVVARKPAEGEAVSNERFRGPDSTWPSPFLRDRRSSGAE
ncbi:Methyltransferase domain-containing protein [Lentzea xinjiangensis]|uniref:Methyltransferase domain-containing protein n=1 Tax=Lentzea xinjiangensis TaxID=402600 RepID=A0A1H9AV39_9PSEU|nr:methyltransferase domain-containing protein [Lentzea xinjiangensis]SEP80610.1 Methyltransferase domain-containing protein [Lentzea xinjiangensis]